jgi:hypothetical protein
MRRGAALLAAVLAALAWSCQENGSSAPWLTYPGVSGHVRWFPLAGTVHDPTAAGATVSCESCHPGNTFAEFDCVTCHTADRTDPLHAGVGDYAHTSAGCYSCHPDGSIAAPADHDTAFFPRGAGSAHAAVACSQCHTDLRNPGDPANFACASCHGGLAGFSTAHAQVAGVGAATPSAQCLVCHGDSQVARVAAHAFTIAPGSAIHDTACLQCHTARRTDKPFAADFAAYECTGCHTKAATDPIHAGNADYVYASASCYGCHPTGGAGAPANHDSAFFPRGTGSAHAGVACLDCHTDLAHPNVAANFRCGTCHLSRDASLVTKHTASASRALRVASSEISTSDSATCLRCHADSQLVTSHPSGGDGWPPHEGARCLQCHDVYRGDKPFAIDFASDPSAQAKFLSSPRHGCYNCHGTYPPRGD